MQIFKKYIEKGKNNLMQWGKKCDRTEPRNVKECIENIKRNIKETGKAKKEKERITM